MLPVVKGNSNIRQKLVLDAKEDLFKKWSMVNEEDITVININVLNNWTTNYTKQTLNKGKNWKSNNNSEIPYPPLLIMNRKTRQMIHEKIADYNNNNTLNQLDLTNICLNTPVNSNVLYIVLKCIRSVP